MTHEDPHEENAVESPYERLCLLFWINNRDHAFDVMEFVRIYPGSSFIQEELVSAASKGNLDVVKAMMTHCDAFSTRAALKTATLNGQVEAVDVLLPNIDEGVDLTLLITSARTKGHDHVALLLVGTGRPFRAHDVFRTAAAAGSMEVVELLIPLADSSHVGSAVATAAEHGHIELVAMLLEKVELARIGTAFIKAAATNQVEILGLLLDVWESRPSKDRAKVCAISNAVKEAISRGNVGVIKLLVDRCEPCLVGPALRVAVVQNNIRAAKILAEVSKPLAIAHEAASAATYRQSAMVSLLLKRCDTTALEAVLEDMVANNNLDTAKFILEKTSGFAINAILQIASDRGCDDVVALVRGLLNASVAKL